MPLKAIFSAINYRILIIVLESFAVYYLYDRYHFTLHIDFTLLSIAIVFPLVFSITSAYQKRQEAISEFNSFRNKIIELTNIFRAVDGIDQKNYNKLFKTLFALQKNLVGVLSQTTNLKIQDIRNHRKEIFYTLESYKKLYNEREKDSIIRVKNELFDSVEKLNNLRVHATPVSLRMYCLIFIYLSPFVYNSHILANFEKNSNLEFVIALFFSVLIGFILMALYNIQEYIEDPFDQEGLDDLKFQEMSVGEEEILS